MFFQSLPGVLNVLSIEGNVIIRAFYKDLDWKTCILYLFIGKPLDDQIAVVGKCLEGDTLRSDKVSVLVNHPPRISLSVVMLVCKVGSTQLHILILRQPKAECLGTTTLAELGEKVWFSLSKSCILSDNGLVFGQGNVKEVRPEVVAIHLLLLGGDTVLHLKGRVVVMLTGDKSKRIPLLLGNSNLLDKH